MYVHMKMYEICIYVHIYAYANVCMYGKHCIKTHNVFIANYSQIIHIIYLF